MMKSSGKRMLEGRFSPPPELRWDDSSSAFPRTPRFHTVCSEPPVFWLLSPSQAFLFLAIYLGARHFLPQHDVAPLSLLILL